MPHNIIAFGASSSTTSINKLFAAYTANLITDATIEILDLNHYELPLFSVDKEKELGSPEPAKAFYQKLGGASGIIVSFAEHNGAYSAAYKNLYDWMSRINTKVYQNKPVLALATSPGKGGGANVLALATKSLPHFGARLVGSLSVPLFQQNFDVASGQLIHVEYKEALAALVKEFRAAL